MEIDVAGALRDLALAADRLAESLEWEALAQQERGSRGLPPFPYRDHNRNDIITLYGQFLSLSMELHAALQDPGLTLPNEQGHAWQRQLRHLVERVQAFGIMDKFIKP
jgi:hypothetical protein